MTVLMHDVHDDSQADSVEDKPPNIDESELLYADDTLLMSKSQKAMTNIVQKIEKFSAEYNMQLNIDKCFHISMN